MDFVHGKSRSIRQTSTRQDSLSAKKSAQIPAGKIYVDQF